MSRVHPELEQQPRRSAQSRRLGEILSLGARQQLAECPDSCRRILTQAYSGKCSPRGAIKAFCLSCTGYVRADVRHCTAQGCPLWLYRPYQVADEADDAEEQAA